MTELNTSQPKRVELTARIIRADGRIEELGVISTWHRNPLVRLWNRLRGKGRVTLADHNRT